MTVHLVDSHIHFWEPTQLRYSWLDGVDVLNQSVLPDHVPAAGEGWVTDGLVFVQADCLPSQALAEAEWVTQLAQTDSRIQGIVAFAPLETPDAESSLNALKALPLVKGIRRLIQSEGPGFCAQPAFIAGVQSLPQYGFTFDLCIKHHQLPEVIALVARCPDVSFVLDHIGKPDINAGLLDPWRDNLKALAQYTNVTCKLSGLIPEANHESWTPSDLKPYIDHVLETFGPDRALFGSDSPVMWIAGASYTQWVEVALAALDGLSPDEKQRVFGENTRRVYGLI